MTDTGLRYALQSNGDSATDDSGIGSAGKQRKAERTRPSEAQTRLGYEKVSPGARPRSWSTFLPTGPRLRRQRHAQPQGS